VRTGPGLVNVAGIILGSEAAGWMKSIELNG